MNSRELKVAYKLYDLLSMRGQLAILNKVEDISINVVNNNDVCMAVYENEPSVRVRRRAINGIEVSANITVSHLDPPAGDELDSVENRLAYLTLDFLTGNYNG